MTDETSQTETAAVERVSKIEHTHIGGQAVIEGVMMRGKYNWAVAVRTSDGNIHVEQHDLGSHPGRRPWTQWPIVRGVVALVDTMSLAMRALSVSAKMAGETEEEQLTEKEVGGVMVVALVIAVGLFMILPNVIARFAAGSPDTSPFMFNLASGVVRVLVLFGYIWAISRMEDIQRVFAYHGAEHKTIHAYEHGIDLEPEGIQKFGTAHVRCGTSFLLMVMIVAFVVYLLIPLRSIVTPWGSTNPDPVFGMGQVIR
ncbi:MAG: DUF1385 domain-containing protein, partial [Actinobacteria bacterium]